jgi:uncharacterized protein
MTHTWFDLLFMHWPIEVNLLRPIVPAFLEIDTFDKIGWIGVVPLGMKNIHFKDMPCLPFTHKFLELNVRTYVRWQGKSGVYFFSLDASNPLAVEVARLWYYLPYFHARMTHQSNGNKITFKSTRTDGHGRNALFDAIYGPVSEPYTAGKGTLEVWLTERYCLLTSAKGKPTIAEIHHRPWPLQKAKADLRVNSMVEALGLQLPDRQPLLHFARELETLEWSAKTIDN